MTEEAEGSVTLVIPLLTSAAELSGAQIFWVPSRPTLGEAGVVAGQALSSRVV